MHARSKPLVSFVVPTLNRRGYVNRAVRSCLAQQSEGVDVEVIVLDSCSDDGSWEELGTEFGGDARVRLLQNERGRGPTASWLDGAAHVSGDAVTFVWSDDYIFPGFAELLLPPILDGASVAFGEGMVRDIDTESVPSVRRPTQITLARPRATGSFLVAFDSELGHLPASPACALFAPSAFAIWKQCVESFSTVNPLVTQLLWRRAIGPDLLLFLIAAACGGPSELTAAFRAPVCQFSAHPGSITVSSSPWRIQVGYWLTRALWFTGIAPRSTLDDEGRAEVTARLLAHGLLLAIRTPRDTTTTAGLPRWQVVRSLATAIVAVLRQSRSRPVTVLYQLLRLAARQATARLRPPRGDGSA